jgi:Co/Zn/Cd efflux system component
MAADAVVSLGVVIAAIAIMATGWLARPGLTA